MKGKFSLFFILFSTALTAQIHLTGNWLGKLPVGDGLSIVFHFSDSSGKLSAMMDSPDQGAYSIKSDTAFIYGDSVKVIIKSARINFEGRVTNDSIIDGVFRQGIKMPLTLKRVFTDTRKNKSQTPKPPFEYTIQDVTYGDKDNAIQLSGTITYPKGPTNKRYPTILMITGSGPQNRDEEIMGHKPFWVIADYLTKKGFAVLRVDDRGTGKSTGKFETATSADFTDDAEASLNYLKTLPFIDTNKIGIAGHSEGGLIAYTLAARRKDVNFLILLAAPGIATIDLMAEQNIALLKANNINEEAAIEYGKMYRNLCNTIINKSDSNTAAETGKTFFQNWLTETNSEILKKLGLQEKSKQNAFINAFTKQINTPWFRYFFTIDPTSYLKQVNCKVLALNGEKDLQVVPALNLEGIRNGLKKSKSKSANEIVELPGLNHLFQKCEKCSIAEYGKLDETFSPEALDVIEKWLQKNIVNK